jgi:hypothetical protein
MAHPRPASQTPLKDKYMRKCALSLLVLLALPQPTHAQSVPNKYDSGASLNPTLVRPGAALVKSIFVTNNTASLYYLKFSDTATTPSCGTTPIVFKVTVPFGASSSGGYLPIEIPDGMQFFNGVAFCLTGAIGDTDTTNAAAGVTINVMVKQ